MPQQLRKYDALLFFTDKWVTYSVIKFHTQSAGDF